MTHLQRPFLDIDTHIGSRYHPESQTGYNMPSEVLDISKQRKRGGRRIKGSALSKFAPELVTERQHGGLLSDILFGSKKARDFLKEHHIISSGLNLVPHPLSKVGSIVAKTLGYGKRKRRKSGGSLLFRNGIVYNPQDRVDRERGIPPKILLRL